MTTVPKTRVGVVGCAGRMGRMLIVSIAESPRAVLAGATERAGHPALGQDPGILAGCAETGSRIVEDPNILFDEADVVIDFTAPAATAGHAAMAAKTGTPLVIGTTGLEGTHEAAIDAAAQSVPILQAANMSLGVNILLGVTQQLATLLDEAYDIEIVEMHHRHKADAPSGTALALGRAAAAGRGLEMAEAAVFSREGPTGPRPEGAIGFATLRGGDVAGDHTVIFAGAGERIELTHRASSRDVFAKGAVHGALWLVGRPPGRYTMRDVLGLATA